MLVLSAVMLWFLLDLVHIPAGSVPRAKPCLRLMSIISCKDVTNYAIRLSVARVSTTVIILCE